MFRSKGLERVHFTQQVADIRCNSQKEFLWKPVVGLSKFPYLGRSKAREKNMIK